MIELFLAALLGLIIGSFLNVCIYRLPRDLSVASPSRSFCPACEQTIPWYDNIPVLSYLILGGKCRFCLARISVRYPVVEMMTSLAFLLVVWRWGVSGDALRLCFFAACLIALFFTDLETRILPDEITLGGALVGWVLAWFFHLPFDLVTMLLPEGLSPSWQSLIVSICGGVVPASGLWLIGELYFRIRGREGLGFGDVKMMLLLGAFLGLEKTILTIIVGSVSGSVVGLTLLALKGKQAARYELPFGTFLAAAGLLVACLFMNIP